MPSPELLETFPNPYADRDYEIFMTCPEFTSLCPLGGIESDADELALLKGGAPDFATISITYIPAKVCVELKSLKFYLWSFRNDGIFYERVVNRILDDLVKAVKPKHMSVVGDFNVRGGIKSVITANYTGRKSEAGKPEEAPLVDDRQLARRPADRTAASRREARIRSHETDFVRERRDFLHERVGGGVTDLMVELHKKSITPRLARRTRLDAAHIHAVPRERRERLEQRAGNVFRGEQQHRARGRSAGKRLWRAREREEARLIVGAILDVGHEHVERIALRRAAACDRGKLRDPRDSTRRRAAPAVSYTA